jgi:hypothetical protein
MKSKSKYLPVLLGLLLLCLPTMPNGQQQETQPEDQAQLISFQDLTYPGVARVTRVQGIVVIKAKLNETGDVVAASALLGPKVLVSDCLANIKKWKFKPNSGKSAIIVYEFRLDDGACHDASRSLFRLIFPNFATITACTPVID